MSLRNLEWLIGYSRKEVRTIAATAGRYYSPFSSHSGKPFSRVPSKFRRIDNPLEPLKSLQRAINQMLLMPVQLPDCILGGVKGKSLKDNIKLHLGAEALVTIDIRNFFPSVTSHQVYRLWNKTFGYSPALASILTKLTTYSGHLPLGAPTSTSLANFVISEMHSEITRLTNANDITFSSWVDDLAFSGRKPQLIMPAVIDIVRQAGFSISHRKIRVMKKGDQKVLTKVVLAQSARVTRRYHAAIRSGINHLHNGDVPVKEIGGYIERLRGSINYIFSLSEKHGNKLQKELNVAIGKIGVTGV